MVAGDAPPDVLDTLRRELHAALPGVELVVTHNRVRMATTCDRGGFLQLRVARELLDLGPGCVDPLVAFASGTKGAHKRLKTLMRQRPPAVAQARTIIAQPLGETHDLSALVEAESQRAFGEPSPVEVTWGVRRRVRRGQRSIRLGSYNPQHQLIRVHPLLDHGSVPGWFVGFILYHELLHHRIRVVVVDGRRRIHTREFRDMERRHPRFEEARRWERLQLVSILSRGHAWSKTRA